MLRGTQGVLRRLPGDLAGRCAAAGGWGRRGVGGAGGGAGGESGGAAAAAPDAPDVCPETGLPFSAPPPESLRDAVEEIVM